MSIIKRFLLLLFLLLALTTGAAAAGTITDLRTDCLVAGNGSCQVTQTVTIEFTGIEQSLTIPLGANAKRASIAGYRAQKTVEDGYTLFQLKDDAGFAGSRTFTVTYTLSGLVTETDGEQTLNLPKWDYPIEHFSFTVTMPKDIETVPGFSSGYYGDVIEDYMTAARQGAVLLGDLDTALKDHESLTMTLALGPRYFTGTYSGWSANWVAAAFCILFAVLALGGLPPLSMIDGALLKYFGADWFASSWNATSGAEILAVVMYVAIIGYFIWDSLRAKPEAE